MNAQGANQTILVVDDNFQIRNLTRVILEKGGFVPVMAGKAQDALDLLREKTVDLALVDVALPDMNGPALVERILEEVPGLPVVFMSAFAQDDLFARGILPPSAHFIPKPFSPAGLLDRLREVLAASAE